MGHYIIQRKWLLHTFGGMAWWGVNYENKIGQSCWSPAPKEMRTFFIIAYIKCLLLRRKHKSNEYRVIDARTEYPLINKSKSC